MAFPEGVEFLAPISPEAAEILTPEAVGLVVKLARAFEGRRQELLAARVGRQARLDAGERPDFLPGTAGVRAGDWTCDPVPADMQDRLFESMVSVRKEQDQQDPHLGLGLYIVRLISGFHGAHALARNLEDGSGVEIRVEFPLQENGTG